MTLVNEWARLSEIPECIAPKGASRINHNFDQTLLFYLIYRYENEFNLNLKIDALDISSTTPIPYARTRNKVPNYISIWMDPFVRAYFWTYRLIDIGLLILKGIP